MTERREVFRELVRRAAIGFPCGAAAVYLVFLLGGLFSFPAPEGAAVPIVTAAMAERWGNPITAALVQFFWSGLLGAVLETAEIPFRLESRTAPWSLIHFLLTAAVFSLAGWQCCWFPFRETWLCLLGLLLLCYLMMWAVRYVGWRQDVRAIRKGVGLPEDPEAPPLRKALPYAALAGGVELFLPWLLRLLDARDVPVLTGIFYPFLILPLFCFFSGVSLAKRCRLLWLAYPVLCAVPTLPCVFLLYNSSALFHVWAAAGAALLGGILGALLRKKMKIPETKPPPLPTNRVKEAVFREKMVFVFGALFLCLPAGRLCRPACPGGNSGTRAVRPNCHHLPGRHSGKQPSITGGCGW